jgi:peptide/nickel transport system substrate-binding protein
VRDERERTAETVYGFFCHHDVGTVTLPGGSCQVCAYWHRGCCHVLFARADFFALERWFCAHILSQSDLRIPGLATKWEMSSDAKTWTFWIRQGVQFHEGYGELTAEDVKYSIERLIGRDSIVGPASPMRALIGKVEVPERYKVVVSLSKPDPELDRGYFGSGQALWIVSKKHMETVGDKAANEHPIGTGPFTLAEHKKGVSIKLKTIEGIEKHWRVKPDFQNITFLLVPEEATRVAMLKTGEVDLAPISYDAVNSVKTSGLNVVTIPYSWTPNIRLGGLDEPKPARYKQDNPWIDKRVRQALNYAVDKDAIIKNIFYGLAKPAGVDNPCREWMDIKAYPYDPAKAKQLLAEAGYPNGFNITLKVFTTSPGAELPMIGEAVGMYWQAIGLNVTIVPIDYPSLRSAWTTDKALDYAWTHRGQAFPTSVVAINASYLSNSAFCVYATKKSDSMIKAITEELSPKKREMLIKEIGEYLRDEGANVFLVFANEPWGASKNVGKWPALSVAPVNIDLITRSR